MKYLANKITYDFWSAYKNSYINKYITIYPAFPPNILKAYRYIT